MTDPLAEALDEFVPAFPSAEGDWQAIIEAASAPPAALVPADRAPRHRLARAWRPQRRWRALPVAVALVATMTVAVAAIAAGLGAFDGIGATQHPRTGADVIDPATAAYMEDKNCNGPGEPACQGRIAGLQLDTTRHLGQLPDGQNIYVVTGTQNDLCTVVGPPHPTWTCNSPLSNSHPSTIFSYYDPPSGPWFTFGVALDGVTSISFQPYQADGPTPGPEVTVPVTDNFWTYQWERMPTVLQPLAAHFADGTTVVEQGKNCAAC